ncbi:gamma-glutamyltransferase [Salipaludibacillus keqinensis]|uniref:Glutathione hydrolase proenzyme n=1 Tax=Salipaludibacillus keqinensis TaxID=2045207 RepID=A0A323TCE9_9BACI|nr:gamma-glutamyltransferase [Salipaludibacillus keqinensis]PYZ92679.1 gamma-glutamyltransferase [Salipaludibacillus keqinensis]
MRHKNLVKVISLLTVFCLLFTMNPFYASAKNDDFFAESVAMGTDGMVSTSHPIASQVGADVLNKGGNAVDAAVAIQYALNVVEPMMSGIGGGGFMMVYDADTDEVSIVNSRERAPAGATPDMFLNEDGSIIPFQQRVRHGNAVGVPGTLQGLEEALDRWGSRPRQQLITPAIQLAQKGFEVDNQLAQAIQSNEEKLSLSAAADVFLPGGEPVSEGDVLVQSDLANTLKSIRSHGADAFYHGEVAEAIAATVQDFGGSMTPEDLANYNLTIDEPVYGDYKDFTIASMPPPSSGGTFLIQMLKILEDFDLGQYDVRSFEKYHLLSETMRLAYADRSAYAGDPEFVDVPVDGLLHPDYIDERRALISLDSVMTDIEPGDPWSYEGGAADYEVEATVHDADSKPGETTHFTVADREGNVVSYTSTIEQVFGSGIMVPGYGFMLNNELTDFDATPGGANQVEPHKRPLSSMTPTMVLEDGKPVLTLGSPGGPRIITAVLQVFLNIAEYDMDLEEAVKEPRIYNTHTTETWWEEGVPADVRAQMTDLGHRLQANPNLVGNVQTILIDEATGEFVGVADERREGAAIGINRPGNSSGKGKGQGK